MVVYVTIPHWIMFSPICYRRICKTVLRFERTTYSFERSTYATYISVLPSFLNGLNEYNALGRISVLKADKAVISKYLSGKYQLGHFNPISMSHLTLDQETVPMFMSPNALSRCQLAVGDFMAINYIVIFVLVTEFSSALIVDI